jgi:hypothetical protein
MVKKFTLNKKKCMELKQLIEKSKTEELSEAEQQELISGMNKQMLELKESDPEKYLEIMKQLNEILEELNRNLEKI